LRCPEFKLQLALPNGNPIAVKERKMLFNNISS
jgi:hypothetical protein